jgi:ATP adenylyltransferase/5',5'''-P-1,P-4-tetraphosphate phosphorylase II
MLNAVGVPGPSGAEGGDIMTGGHEISEKSLMAQFDGLVRREIIAYTEVMAPTYNQDSGLSFEFALADALKRKPGADPQAFEAAAKAPSSSAPSGRGDAGDQPLNASPRPGSDINTAGYEICPLGESHFLSFNKFCLYRPQMLILTNDGFRRQSEPLGRGDLVVARHMLRALGPEYMVMYNCGFESACSRVHKHMHVIPCARGLGLAERPYVPWPALLDPDKESKGSARVPFQYRVSYFDRSAFPSPEELFVTYRGQLEELKIGRSGGVRAHNVIIGQGWLVTVPRRSAGLNGLEPNAAGMLGMVWISSLEKVKAWVDVGPARVLAHCGVPPIDG